MQAVDPHQLPGSPRSDRRRIEVLSGFRVLNGGSQLVTPPSSPLFGMAFPREGQPAGAYQQDCNSHSNPEARNEDAGERNETQ